MSDARELIDRYFDLAPQPDADAYFAQFADDAIVEGATEAALSTVPFVGGGLVVAFDSALGSFSVTGYGG